MQESAISSMNASVSEPESNIIASTADLNQPMILITSGDETISTYASILWASLWNGEQLECADCESSTFIGAVNQLSVVTYADDFSIQYREDITFSYIRIFDEGFIRIYNAVDLSYLDGLPEGIYYIVVVICKQGDYIISKDEYEYIGYECAFKLVVE